MPITVTTVTGLPAGAHRLSPKMVFLALSVIAMVVSEVFTRSSLPPPPAPNHGLVANLIPFKSLNLFTLVYIFLNFAFGAFGLFFTIMSKVDSKSPNTGKLASQASGYFLTMELLCVLLLNRKARAHTRRKVKSWLESKDMPAFGQILKNDMTATSTASSTGQPAGPLPLVSLVQPDLTLGGKEQLLAPARLILVKSGPLTM